MFDKRELPAPQSCLPHHWYHRIPDTKQRTASALVIGGTDNWFVSIHCNYYRGKTPTALRTVGYSQNRFGGSFLNGLPCKLSTSREYALTA